LEHTQFEIEAKNMINEMEQLAETLNLTISETLFVQLREMLMDPSKTLAGRLYKESEKSSQGQVATSIAKENYKKSW
ncbi:bifunctional glutamate--cysteine ligase/glutathione synthetase, partial [Klebsiella pneumoniae]|nr:bifunctional glutamate--cysteine ligase/glutathione synthetase [Klebsiella pneumoniae]